MVGIGHSVNGWAAASNRVSALARPTRKLSGRVSNAWEGWRPESVVAHIARSERSFGVGSIPTPSSAVLEEKREEGEERGRKVATWNTRRVPTRLTPEWSNRLFVACEGWWRGYFPLSGRGILESGE